MRTVGLYSLLKILAVVVMLSCGQVLFKLAADNLVQNTKPYLAALIDLKLIAALAIYTIATLLWTAVLKDLPLRIAYPFFSLTFLTVPALAYFFLNENIGWHTIAGACMIVLGVFISIYK